MHTDPRIYFWSNLRWRQISSDKKFFWWTWVKTIYSNFLKKVWVYFLIILSIFRVISFIIPEFILFWKSIVSTIISLSLSPSLSLSLSLSPQLSLSISRYTEKSYMDIFHANTFSYENYVNIMRKRNTCIWCKENLQYACEKRAIINPSSYLLYISWDYYAIILRFSCESRKSPS